MNRWQIFISERDKHSSSIESPISTRSISEHEQQAHCDMPSKSSPLPTQTEQSVDLLDLFSTPLVPLSNSPTNPNENKNHQTKNLLDDSLSSISFEEENQSKSESIEKEQTAPPIVSQQKIPSKHSSPTTSIKEELSSSSKQIDEPEIEYQLPKPEPPPAAKPLNKARINEFASLLSSAVHLSQPVNTKAPAPLSSTHSETRKLSNSERESYQTLPSNTNSDSEQAKKHIDASYNEKIDDRKSLQVNSSNIKALFEQKISDANKARAQSNDNLAHIQENKQHYRKAPVSYAYVNKQNTQPIIRRQSFQDSTNMNKYFNQLTETKDILIEDKQPEPTHQTQPYSARRNNTDQIVRPNMNSAPVSPVQIANGYYAESLIAREIRETKEKEEALRQQRKKCGLPEDVSALLPPRPNQDANRTEQASKPAVKNSAFLSNLDFFTSKSSESNSPRRATTSIQNLVYDSQNSSSNDERKTNINQESPFLSVNRTNSIQRTSSSQNLLSPQTKANIIQREIEAMRAKESELRQLGRIQHTSDEHSDPRKYQELVPQIPKSQSANVLSTGKIRKETERLNVPILPNSNGILKPKTMNNGSISSVRGRFPSPNPTAPIISASNRSIDYSKLSSTERLELEKREAQERELELRKQRHSITGNMPVVNATINSDSGNASQDDDEHENYLDKIQRLKRTENEKTQVPLQRPIKKSNLSQKWEQMVANKNTNSNFSDDHN